LARLDFESEAIQELVAGTVRYNHESNKERDKAVERLREFLRFNYLTGSQVAGRIGVRDTTLYAWLQGKKRQLADGKLLACVIPNRFSGHEMPCLDSPPSMHAERRVMCSISYCYGTRLCWISG
jgi:hypothetical protein